jgi:hypothetical protein
MVRILHYSMLKSSPAHGVGGTAIIMLAVPIERLATEELMNAARSKSAWLALLAAGGLYAWKNRNKIQGWLNTQSEQFNNQSSNSFPATGATRRIDAQDVPTHNDPRGIYNAD